METVKILSTGSCVKCHQLVNEILDKSPLLRGYDIQILDAMDKDNRYLIDKYKISKVPTIILHNDVVSSEIYTVKDLIEFLEVN